MNRETIDYGIDLGTTNSCIAVWGTDGQVEVIKNIDQFQTTPSCVWIDKKNRTKIGLAAKNRVAEGETEDVHKEFKQQMGRGTAYEFPASGAAMTPEELSAEVLKELKKNVQRRFNEDLSAAVITIPAAFERSEIYATNRAAKLAGFDVSPLCQEPVAAALAYGHKSTSDEGFWMVFDFGGGTFDSAVVQLRSEEFQIITHAGDNQLGGKDIDWAIMDEILIPSVQNFLNIPEFSRESEDFAIKAGIAKLKMKVEQAKERLSSENSAEIIVEFNGLTGDEDKVEFEFELTRDAVDSIAEPYVLRAVNLCKDALNEKRLKPDDIEKLILVGGPTQMPIFREILADSGVGLGIPLEYSVDPMTVVAQGAAIFARGQKLEVKKSDMTRSADEVSLELNYEPAGPDDDPDIAGRIILPEEEGAAGFTIEFYKNNWRSGQIAVSDEGAFFATLSADKGENFYSIELCDGTGKVHKTSPAQISYLRKAVFREIPLTHTISIAQADNSIDVIFEKGMPLPLRKLRSYHQTIPVLKSQNSGEIRIPLVEGSNERADRNSSIGDIVISPSEVKRDIPALSDIDLIISVDESNILTVVAEIPTIDQEFDRVLDPFKPDLDRERLRVDAEFQISRLESLKDQAQDVDDERVDKLLVKIKDQKLLEEVQRAISHLGKGGEAEDLLVNRMRNLQVELDKVEDMLEWPKYLSEAEKNRADAEVIVTQSTYADTNDKSSFDTLCREHQNALEIEDVDLLRRVSSEFNDLYYDIARRTPAFWAGLFEDVANYRSDMSDQGLANELFAQGHRSVSNGDVDGLKSAVRQLVRLMPSEVAEAKGFKSTVIS